MGACLSARFPGMLVEMPSSNRRVPGLHELWSSSLLTMALVALAACGGPIVPADGAGDARDGSPPPTDATDATDAADGGDTAGPYCGDNACNAGESCSTCARDCRPCVVSMSVDTRVEGSSDDAEEDLATGAVNITSTDLEFTSDGAITQAVGIRFHPPVPPGATITRAWIQFQVDEATSTPTTLTVHGEAADDAAAFTTAANGITSRARTTASVTWVPAAWPTVGDATDVQRTPDLTSAVQEIVSRPAWAAGGRHLAAIVTGTGWRVAESFDKNGTGAPLLHVEFTSPVATGCGNGTCDGGESCSNCVTDCGVCSACGNGACDAGETCTSCRGDCGPCTTACGDGTCGLSEHCQSCPGDCGACTGTPPTLTRGPYLNNGSTTAVTVRWRTSAPTDSVVAYGPSAAALGDAVRIPGSRTEHAVRLTGLSPDTRYYYAVGANGAPLVGDATYSVVTAPATPRATRVWVLGDSGTANANQRHVRDAYYAAAGTRPTDLWLMLGDNAYVDGTDAQYQAAVFDVYPTMLRSSVLWATLGNHDGHSADSATQTGPYYDIFSLPTTGEAGGVPSGTEAYYAFDYGAIHFVCLDSYDSDRSPTGPMLTWLRNDLMATTSEWIIAFFHHPPYSKGSHNSDAEGELIAMRTNALPILENFGVDLVLSGHSHSYERSYYLNGHYGLSTSLAAPMIVNHGDGRTAGDGAYARSPTSNTGAVYVVAGSSGQVDAAVALNHPAMFVSLPQMGSVIIDVDGAHLDAQFVSDTGAISDTFRIEHR